MVAAPLRDLFATKEKARARLWAACDLAEMLLRFAVTLGIAEIKALVPDQPLPADLLKILYRYIEEPTLGAWQDMANAVAREVQSLRGDTFPELPALIKKLGELLRGSVSKPKQHEENALIAVRNAFAHGGGVTERRAGVLLRKWQPALNSLIASAAWLSEIELLVVRQSGQAERFAGADCVATPTPLHPELVTKAGAVWPAVLVGSSAEPSRHFRRALP